MGSFKRTLQNALGDKGYTKLIKILNIWNVRIFYKYDNNKFSKYAFGLRNKQDSINLRARITLNYHALEKGLSNVNMRPGFGRTAIYGLLNSFKEYLEKDYDRTDIRFQTGLSVMKSYIEKHDLIGYDISDTKKRFAKYRGFLNEQSSIGGITMLTKQQVLSESMLDFVRFARSRHSVRDFSPEPVPIETINTAIEIAVTTPSVCNRQAWQVIIINNGDTLEKVLALQGGLSSTGRNIDKLLVITTDNRYFYSGKERNQGYVDGGLFSMNLVYAMHSLGLATCMLNANLSLGNEKSVKSLLSIHPATNIIMFVAVGSYLDTFKVTKSQRDKGSAFTSLIE